MIQTREAAWYRFLTTDDTYDPDRLAFDQELLRRFYLARGYAEFTVVSAIAELTPEGDAFFLTFTLEEGPQYNFGKITIDSRLKRPDAGAAAEQFVHGAEGEVYNADQVEETIQALTDEVGRLGYAFARVEPVARPEPRGPDRRRHLSRSTKGPRVYVERIDIHGNVRTLDEVIRREFRLAEGDAFNTALLRRSRAADPQSRLLRDGRGAGPRRAAPPTRSSSTCGWPRSRPASCRSAPAISTSDGVLGDMRLTRAQPARPRPGAARQLHRLAAAPGDRLQLHRALLPRPRSRGRLRPVLPRVRLPVRSRPTTRPRAAARCAPAIR